MNFSYFKGVLFAFLLLPGMLLADATITGTVTDGDTDEPLPGVNVVIQGTSLGAATNQNGIYEIENVNLIGERTVAARMIGYELSTQTVDIPASGSVEADFELTPTVLEGEGVSVVANRARDRETPVAFSNVEKQEIEYRLGNQDIPLVLNTEPGVYATAQGGGPGDSRINIRGFNQRNVAVMINGVPVNDMENGWVYWSNWDGLGNVTSSIQLQRGLGASNLSIASVGGTMNILTDPADLESGVTFKQQIGAGNYFKSSLMYNTGLMDNGLAASIAIGRKTQDGLIDQTWLDAYNYYGALSYSLNKNHKFDLYIIGAPQRHGQRLYQQNIATFDKEYARDLDDFEGEDDWTEYGMDYNPNWGVYDSNYDEYFALWTANASTHERPDYKKGILMERENYYHKPQVNFNWYGRINERLNFTNVAYYSQGIGGGTGSYGRGLYRYPADSQGRIPWNAIRDTNRTTIDPAYSSDEYRATTVLRNSVNQHNWFGDIFTARYMLTDQVKLTAGIDWRRYIGEHYREVRNLLGADYYVDFVNNNQSTPVKRLGDKINYHNDGLTRWLGGFGQIEGNFDRITAFGSYSYSVTSYKRVDYFLPKIDGDWNSTGWNRYPGWTLKGGLNYNFTDALNVYVNYGYLSKAPIFDAVYHYDNSKYAQTFNEKVNIAEIGVGYSTRFVGAKLNLYNTTWQDRSWPTSARFEDESGNETIYRYLLQGIDARHQGIELDARIRPVQMFELGIMASLGNYEWLNDVSATFSPDDNPQFQQTTSVYTEGLKVGGSAQTTFALQGMVRPTATSSVQLVYNIFMDHYADFDPADRDDPDDRVQPWKVPNYGLLDFHAFYSLPIDFYGVNVRLLAHGYNVLDTKHITDATDNDFFNATDFDHDADDAGVFFGLPRRFTLGLEVNF